MLTRETSIDGRELWLKSDSPVSIIAVHEPALRGWALWAQVGGTQGGMVEKLSEVMLATSKPAIAVNDDGTVTVVTECKHGGQRKLNVQAGGPVELRLV